MIKVKDKFYRNLEEQVQYLTEYHDVNQGLVQWGIRVVGQVETEDELPLPYDGEYGDAIAVGTQAPFFFYIWTRASIEGNPAYWFPFGEISIVGPEGPRGESGPAGIDGISTMWYSGSSVPDSSSQDYVEGDMYLQSNGQVYRYQNGSWQSIANIKGPQGILGVRGEKGEKGETGPAGPKGDRGDVGGFINIYGILSNTDQLPLPPTLSNLSIAYLVGSSEPYDLYIQIGNTSADAVWTNTGPFNAATLVTVNGQGLNVWDADTKVGFTDYASSSNAGVIMGNSNAAFILQNGRPQARPLTSGEYSKAAAGTFVGKGTLEANKYTYVKEGIVGNTKTLTDTEKADACKWLGAATKEEVANAVAPPTLELINTVTVVPDTDGSLPKTVNFTMTDDGETFKLKKAKVVVTTNSTDEVYTSGTIAFLVRWANKTLNRVVWGTIAPSKSGRYGKGVCDIEVVDKVAYATVSYKDTLTDLGGSETSSCLPLGAGSVELATDYIEELGVTTYSDHFTAGTQIFVYGVKQ